MPVISLIIASLAIPFYTARGSLSSLGLSIPDIPSHLIGFLSLASKYPAYGVTQRHAKFVREIPITVCRTQGWVFSASVTVRASDPPPATFGPFCCCLPSHPLFKPP